MLIARQLKKQNIAEYLLYMWQIEDMIRALNGDMSAIKETIVDKYPVDDDTKKSISEWYESMVDMMNTEGVMQKGHIQLVKNTLLELEELNDYLVSSGKDVAYTAKLYQLIPSLALLKSKSDRPGMSNIEMCFIFLYGFLQLQRQKKNISEDTQRMREEVSKLLAMLSADYTKWKAGELDKEE